MKRPSSKEIIPDITNGNEEVLVYISRKYFPSVRRMLRVRGIRDEQTPVIFAEALANVYSELRFRADDKIEFDSYFMNALDDVAKRFSENRKNATQQTSEIPEDVAAKCVSILDPGAQKLLFAKVAGQYSYERIRDEFNFSNAVIAQYEVTKVMDQLEGIVKLRMNISSKQHE